MKTIVLLAGIAALAAASPALAGPGKGHGHSGQHGKSMHGMSMHGGSMHYAGYNRDDRREHGSLGLWGSRCPPGLAKKNNGCLPPGQARKRYNVGQRWSNNYGQNWTYNQIPQDWRSRYNLSANDRYYYRDGYLYQVNPRTNLVAQVLSALVR